MNLQLNKNVTQTERQKTQRNQRKNAELNKPVTDQRRFESRARLKQDSKHRDPKTSKARGGPKQLSTDISALCLLQDSQEAYLRPR